MEILLNTTLISLFFGTFGTTIGGVIGISFKSTSNKFLSFVLEFAAGLMIAIICFELIPKAIEISNIFNIIIAILVGVAMMIFCDNMVKYRYSKKTNVQVNSLLRTGIVVGIGLAIHNFPERTSYWFWL
ncbi:MAG: hypothetical protein FWF46_05330 [Oscillospiraceae bacterium]|nr:hypothetical protein [Oscillospiraceae bacterium]